MDHRAEVGGKGEMWDLIGRLQFDFLKSQGLRPNNTLLDVGCGSLRGGVYFIPYLDEGRYYGIDASDELIDAGILEELPSDQISRIGGLQVTESFEIPHSWPRFDFAIAQSVLPHLSPYYVDLCIRRVCARLSPDGKFFATFFNGDGVQGGEKTYPNGITAYRDRDPWFHNQHFLREIAGDYDYVAEFIGDIGHPRDQQVMLFRRQRNDRLYTN